LLFTTKIGIITEYRKIDRSKGAIKMIQNYLEKALEEVKAGMGFNQKQKQSSNKGLWIGLAVGVIATLVGLVLWLRSKNNEDIEEYYEYFDDEIEDALEEDLYGEEEDDVEYVQIKNFGEDKGQAEELEEDEE
jgi:hypothetical protein